MPQTPLLYIGVSGTVLAVDRATGQEIWRTRLKATDFVNVVVEDGAVYASARGELFCLDPATGQIRWKNPLTGLGWGLVSIAAAAGSQSVLLREKKRRDEAAAAAAATGAG
jgi:outer membrane protein assembly factor BamB